MLTKSCSNFLKHSSIVILLLFTLFCSHATANLYHEDRIKKQKMEAMYESYKTKAFPDISSLSIEQVLNWQKNENIVLIDTRTSEEREVSMIPSAITLEEFEKNIDAYQDYKIVYYCTIGYRSGLETKEALEKNLDAYNLRGGVLAWAHAGQTFFDLRGESLNVHVYGRKWNLTPQNYIPVW